MDKRDRSFTILIIDDEPLILELAAELLATDGYHVLSAESGREGLSRARTHHPDLILVDYHMPEMNGLAVVQQLKADTVTRRIPVVALTSSTAESANELSRAGTVGFIPKPFDPLEFLRLVAEFLDATVGRSRRRGDPPPDA